MKKGKIFVNKINDKIGNNQNFCEVVENNSNINNDIDNNENDNIDDKLKKLFNINGYIFNTNVKIITNNKTYNTKVASRVGNSLITLDNDIINIDDIKSISF